MINLWIKLINGEYGINNNLDGDQRKMNNNKKIFNLISVLLDMKIRLIKIKL